MANDPLSIAGTTRPVPTGLAPPRPNPDIRTVESPSGTSAESTKGGRVGADGRLAPTTSERADPNAKSAQSQTTFEQLSEAVENLNEMMRRGQHVLTFQIDQESDAVVIRVVDSETDEVIRQIPSEETLRFAEYVNGLVGMIFNEQA